VELFIIRVKFAIYNFLHCNTLRQVAARLRAKSAMYDCLVYRCLFFFKLHFALSVLDMALRVLVGCC